MCVQNRVEKVSLCAFLQERMRRRESRGAEIVESTFYEKEKKTS